MTNTPIIDWNLATQLAGNKRDVAEELLKMLITTLPTERDAIKQAIKKQDFALTARLLHKLRGAVAYCGVPRLKEATIDLENAIKNRQIKALDKLVSIFQKEIDLVIKKRT